MHFVYFAEQKLERFYDFLVERTEETVANTTGKEVEGKAAFKGKGTIGSLLAMLGLGQIEIEAEVSTSGRLTFHNELITKFTAAQKLKALLLKLDSEGKLLVLSAGANPGGFLKEGTPVLFSARLKTDYHRRPEVDVETKRAAILTGSVGAFSIEVQASLQHMESENAWRRWGYLKEMVGFGTLIGVCASKRLLEFDPIILAYAQPW